MHEAATTDAAATVRRARFGKLPERIRYEDMTQEVETDPNARTKSTYNPEGAWNYYSCLALDLGL
ncbi:hypothetical protein OKJ48_17420 [Streptomyces kunmingensis]|uniref:Uncharacterized protein n=1 Tax=Streptomyces kunmingensis TaxID=68225 RepID=A0ABU6CBE3_9ACTN|nr:hypothetical protein [Streptomyces kunmingensis]MEB3962013.1 hypothetical protein [Streptomyces kunmingensis]